MFSEFFSYLDLRENKSIPTLAHNTTWVILKVLNRYNYNKSPATRTQYKVLKKLNTVQMTLVKVTEALVQIKNKSCRTLDLSRAAGTPAGQRSRSLVTCFTPCIWEPFMHLQLQGCLIYSMFASDAFGEAAAATATAY